MEIDNDVQGTNLKIYIKGLSFGEEFAYKNFEILNKAACGCKNSEEVTLVIPEGIYHIANEKSMALFNEMMAGTIDPCDYGRWIREKNIVFKFENCKNIIIEGNGAKLVFNGLIQPFEFTGCHNVILRNIVIDWKRPLFSEGIIKLVNEDTITVEVSGEFPVSGKEPVVSFQEFDMKTGHLTGVCPFEGISPFELVSQQTVMFTTSNDAVHLKPGNLIIMRHIYNYAPAIHFFNCSEVEINEVELNSCPGMGIIAHRTENVSIRGLKCIPGSKRTMSTNTDATHFISCTGNVEIDGCCFEGMGDDAANVHSFYFVVREKLAPDVLLATIDILCQDGLFDYPDAGDKVEFIKRDTLMPYAEGIIELVEIPEGEWNVRLRFKNPLPDEFEMSDLIANTSKLARFRFINNRVRDIRGRAVLIQTRDALVENCSFEYCTGQGIHISTATGWWESIGTRDVVIRNNKFINCGYGMTKYCDAVGVVIESECDIPAVGVHRDIVIEDNYIQGHSKPGICISSADGVTIRGNDFKNCSIPVAVKHFSSNITCSTVDTRSTVRMSDCR